MLIFITFSTLLYLTLLNSNIFYFFIIKNREDWLIDSIGLCFQGIVIPILQVTLVFHLYHYFIPSLKSTLFLHPFIAFCLSFIVIDYLYYWNHRLFHTSWLWSVHRVHHTVTTMDVVGTSRNTLWTSFLIIYLWVHSLFIYLLQDPSWYIFGSSLTSALDLWRHSIFSPQPKTLIYHLLSAWLILPQDHAWHHASNYSGSGGNYGANFKIWDKIHGTYCHPEIIPISEMKLGMTSNLSLTKKLFLPF
ncbi:MAG: sterol desaturase family protein [Calothrix sp. C42_A2020_038]|nr:sterol desaturase family protein [Calothrix sp. C42_A2020_038]